MRKYIVLIVIILAGTYYFNIGNDSKTDVKSETNNSVKDIAKTPVVKKTYRPENGYSPYNSFFGKGIYNNKTDNKVDAIAGSTITGNGVTSMIKDELKLYIPYFKTLKNS